MFTNFSLKDVQLEDASFAHRRELTRKYIEKFDIDRLMHTFRKNAGIESSAEPLGGWESETCGVRGQFVGHFLSACAKFAFADQDEDLKNKAHEIVNIMEECAQPNGYLSAFEEENLDVLEWEEDREVWAPYYPLHKILQGLIDSHNYLGNEKALRLAVDLAGYIYERFRKLSYWKIDGVLRCTKVNPKNEFGGIGDALYSLYEITLDPEIINLAKLFDRNYFLGPLAEGRDILEDLHANTHLPMVIAAMHRYNLTGETFYKNAAANFYKCLLGRTFANGNNSSKATAYLPGKMSERAEHWGPYNDLGDALTGSESESCCAHNTEKIIAQLFAWTGDVQYLDHLEVLKYNAVLNSASKTSGLSQYHQPMGGKLVKNFSSLYDSFWCCTGSGIEAMSELPKNIWFKEAGTILLNTFISSTVFWQEKDIRITQRSDFPDSPVSTLYINASEPTEFTLLLKASAVKEITINSKRVNLTQENGYIKIWRVFEDKDIIRIEIEASLHLEYLQGCSDVAALMYGKILLAQLNSDGSPECIELESDQPKLIKSSSKQLKFTKSGDAAGKTEFVPLYSVEDERYTVYLNV